MKLQLIMLGVGILTMVLGSIGMISFANNTSAAMINGLVFGFILSAIINIIVIKFSK